MNSSRTIFLFLACAILAAVSVDCLSRAQVTQPHANHEYLWYEAENMRGITETSRHEPLLNPSYLELPAAKAPGWSISGPGVSAEWTQGGESEWNSVAAAADEKRGMIWQDIEIPRAGQYKIWVRYADWANKTETFVARITQQGREVGQHKPGVRSIVFC